MTLARRGELEAMVTGPIHKARMYEVGFRVPGANRIFRGALRRKKFRDVFDRRKTHRCARHGAHSLRKVPRALKKSEIVRVGLLLAEFLRSRRQKCAPRIAVAGLNPHAGESGELGVEEIEIIAPAIEELNSSLVTVTRHPFSSVRFLPTPFSTARLKANATPCFACTTIRD